mmetsp:Transcript_8750/g.18372  ORF Transcript_8750/g.18372 Transcript_8750/m.18372 type:complete len:136 (+) Transcript_8750:348-755(+)
MEEDHDDLAAASFAQQAAKEEKKAVLPINDWVTVIQARASCKESGRSSPSRLAWKKDDAKVWLTTNLPGMREYQVVKSNANDGLIGISLDSNEKNEARMNINRNNNTPITRENDEVCERLRKCLVETLLERTTFS